ncbi:MAG: hypothetical protein AVDCRST_MAG10-425 [uncultured Acidimicrobiales bacterium]|uniref:Uncharacterized protein n=1 Tax=uncultured Acidimicrobiales bacterium TaxID=310071 RepID=A0A6J4H8B1_9ACTN|nr:MAG: hypothetical protein AVDCRST_MAG10-425 [uncultured Acidimicrobiales bacterium]
MAGTRVLELSPTLKLPVDTTSSPGRRRGSRRALRIVPCGPATPALVAARSRRAGPWGTLARKVPLRPLPPGDFSWIIRRISEPPAKTSSSPWPMDLRERGVASRLAGIPIGPPRTPYSRESEAGDAPFLGLGGPARRRRRAMQDAFGDAQATDTGQGGLDARLPRRRRHPPGRHQRRSARRGDRDVHPAASGLPGHRRRHQPNPPSGAPHQGVGPGNGLQGHAPLQHANARLGSVRSR